MLGFLRLLKLDAIGKKRKRTVHEDPRKLQEHFKESCEELAYDILPSTKSGRVWRKVPESDARSVCTSLTPYRLAQAAREAKVVGRQ